MKTVKFVGIDSWHRPIFQADRRDFYGSTDILFSRDATEMEVLEQVSEKDLTYFGTKFGCEPMGTPSGNIKISRSQEGLTMRRAILRIGNQLLYELEHYLRDDSNEELFYIAWRDSPCQSVRVFDEPRVWWQGLLVDYQIQPLSELLAQAIIDQYVPKDKQELVRRRL